MTRYDLLSIICATITGQHLMTQTIVCITSYYKGGEFIVEAKKQGCHIILLTVEKLKDSPWPRDYIDEIFLMPNLGKLPDVLYAVAYLARSNKIDAIVPLDEYDVEMAAVLREHLQIDGMSMSQTKTFRDKLAMRVKTQANGVRVPEFTPVLNYDVLRDYMQRVPAPWVLKPRLEAGAMGIKKIHNDEELWRWLDELGDQQSFRVLEQFVPGDVYHVDSIIDKGKVVFASFQKYGAPPMSVAHDGGVFVTRTLAPKSAEVKALTKMNSDVIKALEMKRGVTHAEFIRAHDDGQYYFLEIAARVGGAHISDLVEQSRGVNLWAEWARLIISHLRGEAYTLPKTKNQHGALLVCLSKQEQPDMSAYDAPEVVWHINKKQHAGLVVASGDYARMEALLEDYHERFVKDFLAVAPPMDSPPD